MKKKLILLLAGLLFCMSLTGCIKNRTDIRFHMFGGMNFSTDLLLSKTLNNLLQEQGSITDFGSLRESLPEPLFHVKEKKEGSYSGFSVEGFVPSLDLISAEGDVVLELEQFMDKDRVPEKYFGLHKGLFMNTYTLDLIYDLTPMIQLPEELGGMVNALTKGMELSVTMHFPGKILEQNADSADGKTLYWEIGAEERKEIRVSFRLWNLPHLALYVMTPLLLIFIILLLVSQNRKAVKIPLVILLSLILMIMLMIGLSDFIDYSRFFWDMRGR